jgi:hypothetical protein
MQKPRNLILITTTLFITFSALAQDAKEKGLEAITERAVRGQLEFLASDWTEGRHTGRPGIYLAADYIASLFQVYGLEPGGDPEYAYPTRAQRMAGMRPTAYRSYFQHFDLIEYKSGENHEFSIVNISESGTIAIDFDYRTDFSVRTSDVAVDIEMPVVFAGYGFTDEKSGYDDFRGLDVAGKIILILSGYPGQNDTTSKAYKAFRPADRRSRGMRYRARAEKYAALGVTAVIEVDPGRDVTRSWSDNIPFRYNTPDYEGDEPRASFSEYRMKIPGDKVAADPTSLTISDRALNELLKNTGLDLQAFAGEVKNSLKPASRELSGKKVRIKTSVESRMIRVRNVIGVLPGKDTSEIIVIGGHYDHLGKHDGWIWNGADDNASGTVGVMTLAKACMATGEKPEKTIVFAAWTGEEKGLLGSKYFADHPYNDTRMILNLNYDMISRDSPDDSLGVECSMVYTKNYPVLKELADQHNEEYGLGLDISYRPSDRPGGGSDHTSFANKDVPVFYFMAGFPPEYHQPDDHTGLVNWKKMTNIIKVGYLNVWELANTEWGPDPVTSEPGSDRPRNYRN